MTYNYHIRPEQITTCITYLQNQLKFIGDMIQIEKLIDAVSTTCQSIALVPN